MKKTGVLLWMVAMLAGAMAFGQEEVPPAFEKERPDKQIAEEMDPFDPVLNAPKVLRICVEHVELDHKQLTKLLMDDKPKTTDASGLRMKVQGLVDKDEAKIIDTNVIVCQDRQKASVDSVQELEYPMAYEEVSSFGDPQNVKEKKRNLYDENFRPIPTLFTSRRVGSTLEVETKVAADGKLIEMKIVPEMTWYCGQRVWYEGKDAAGNPFTISMPDFYTSRFNTSFSCVGGQYFLAGVASPKNTKGEMDTDRKIMCFVKTDALPAVP